VGDAEQEPSEPLPSQEAAVLRGHEGPVLAARFNHNGQYCLTCGKDRTLRCVRCCGCVESRLAPFALL